MSLNNLNLENLDISSQKNIFLSELSELQQNNKNYPSDNEENKFIKDCNSNVKNIRLNSSDNFYSAKDINNKASNNLKLSTIMEDNEIINHLSMISKNNSDTNNDYLYDKLDRMSSNNDLVSVNMKRKSTIDNKDIQKDFEKKNEKFDILFNQNNISSNNNTNNNNILEKNVEAYSPEFKNEMSTSNNNIKININNNININFNLNNLSKLNNLNNNTTTNSNNQELFEAELNSIELKNLNNTMKLKKTENMNINKPQNDDYKSLTDRNKAKSQKHPEKKEIKDSINPEENNTKDNVIISNNIAQKNEKIGENPFNKFINPALIQHEEFQRQNNKIIIKKDSNNKLASIEKDLLIPEFEKIQGEPNIQNNLLNKKLNEKPDLNCVRSFDIKDDNDKIKDNDNLKYRESMNSKAETNKNTIERDGKKNNEKIEGLLSNKSESKVTLGDPRNIFRSLKHSKSVSTKSTVKVFLKEKDTFENSLELNLSEIRKTKLKAYNKAKTYIKVDFIDEESKKSIIEECSESLLQETNEIKENSNDGKNLLNGDNINNQNSSSFNLEKASNRDNANNRNNENMQTILANDSSSFSHKEPKKENPQGPLKPEDTNNKVSNIKTSSSAGKENKNQDTLLDEIRINLTEKIYAIHSESTNENEKEKNKKDNDNNNHHFNNNKKNKNNNLLIKAETSQSLNGKENNPPLTSRDIKLSAEEEMKRHFLLRKLEKQQIERNNNNSQTSVLTSSLAKKLKENLKVESNLKIYNIKCKQKNSPEKNNRISNTCINNAKNSVFMEDFNLNSQDKINNENDNFAFTQDSKESRTFEKTKNSTSSSQNPNKIHIKAGSSKCFSF